MMFLVDLTMSHNELRCGVCSVTAMLGKVPRLGMEIGLGTRLQDVAGTVIGASSLSSVQ